MVTCETMNENVNQKLYFVDLFGIIGCHTFISVVIIAMLICKYGEWQCIMVNKIVIDFTVNPEKMFLGILISLSV